MNPAARLGLANIPCAIVLLSTATLSEAEAAFRQGVADRNDAARARISFRRAADLFGQAWQAGDRSPGVAVNRARAALLADDVPTAVQACRLGLADWPTDADLLHTLAVARQQVTVPADADVPGAPPAFSPTTLANWSPWVFVVACLLIAVAFVAGRGVRWAIVGVVVASLTLAFSWWETESARQHWRTPTAVVTVRDGLVLRKGNGWDYPSRRQTPLPTGYEVRIVGERGEWLQVQLADGVVGWLPAGGVDRLTDSR